MPLIPLTRGYAAVVDEADHAAVARFTWSARPDRHGRVYAQRAVVNAVGIHTTEQLHRYLTGAGPDQVVDHRNGDTLDNRRANLRVCSRAENGRNGNGRAGRAGRFKGTMPGRGRGKWIAAVTVGGRSRYLGTFATDELAAAAYDAVARAAFGPFARLNFPRPGEQRAALYCGRPFADAAYRTARHRTRSGFRGVLRVGRRWAARLCVGPRQVHVGTFDAAKAAARAYDAAAVARFGAAAVVNFPPG